MGQTEKNLREAFAGESQANRRYLAFARKAEEEGFKSIARLFRAAAQAETVHALNHLRVLKGVGSTVENLQAAIEGEGYEIERMYPQFLKVANEEGERQAVNSFSNALEVEKVHHRLYEEALQAVRRGEDLPAKPIFVCQVCGNTVWGEAPETCPICGAPKSRFEEVN